MPLAVLWILGAVGALAAAQLIAREARRINAELHPGSGHSLLQLARTRTRGPLAARSVERRLPPGLKLGVSWR